MLNKIIAGNKVDWTPLEPLLDKIVRNIVGKFEGGTKLKHMYENVTGNFDGMGISAGILQWNYGCGSLQPILKLFIKRYGAKDLDAYFKDLIPAGGKKVSATAKMSASSAIAVAKTWQSGSGYRWNFKAGWRTAWKKLMASREMQDIQNEKMNKIWEKVKAYVKEWGFAEDSVRAHAFFLDIVTQNGGMKNRRGSVTLVLVKQKLQDQNYIKNMLEDYRRAVLKSLNKPLPGYKDYLGVVKVSLTNISKATQDMINSLRGSNWKNNKLFFDCRLSEEDKDKITNTFRTQAAKNKLNRLYSRVKSNANYQLWQKDQVPNDKEVLTLLVAAYLRSSISNPKWRIDVFNRKGTNAVGKGWVHTSLYDFSNIYNS